MAGVLSSDMRVGLRHVVAIATIAASMVALLACQGPSTPDAADPVAEAYPGARPRKPATAARSAARRRALPRGRAGSAVPAGAAARWHRRVPLLPGRPEAERGLVHHREPVPAPERGDRAPRDPVRDRTVRCGPCQECGRRHRRRRLAVLRRHRALQRLRVLRCAAGPSSAAGHRAARRRWSPASPGSGSSPAARSCCRCTTTCWRPAGSPARSTSPRYGCGSCRVRPTVTPLSALLLPAPIELPCTPQESGPLCDRDKAIDDLVARTGSQARTVVTGLNLLCNGGSPPVAGATQHCDIPIRRDALRVLGRAAHASAGPRHLGGAEPGHAAAPGCCWTRRRSTSTTSRACRSPNRSGSTVVTSVRVTCTHDATLRSQLPELKPLQPRYVVWGDGTSDEMCLAILITARSEPASLCRHDGVLSQRRSLRYGRGTPSEVR